MYSTNPMSLLRDQFLAKVLGQCLSVSIRFLVLLLATNLFTAHVLELVAVIHLKSHCVRVRCVGGEGEGE